MKRTTRRMVQCPCCGRGLPVKMLRDRVPTHPGGVYDHTVWSEGRGNIKNDIVTVKDAEVTDELQARCRRFLKR